LEGGKKWRELNSRESLESLLAGTLELDRGKNRSRDLSTKSRAI